MTAVCGISIGTTSIRLARGETSLADPSADGSAANHESADVWSYDTMPVPRAEGAALDAAAAAASTARTTSASAPVVGVAVVRNELRQASDDEIAARVDGAHLFGESSAALRAIAHSTLAAQYDTVAIYDLGATGLSVSLVDTGRQVELGAARSTLASGDLFDREVQNHLVTSGILSEPTTPEQQSEVIAFCRGVKESLSTTVLAQTPGGGTLLMSRNQFEQAVYLPIEETAKIVSELGLRCRRTAQAVVVIGGGAHIPVVMTVLARWLNVPVLVPERPETVVAQGAALLAGDIADSASTDVGATRAGEAAADGRVSGRSASRASLGFTARLDGYDAAASGQTVYAVAEPPRNAAVPDPVAVQPVEMMRPTVSWLDRLLNRLPSGAGLVAAFVALCLVGLWAAGQSLLRPSEQATSPAPSTSESGSTSPAVSTTSQIAASGIGSVGTATDSSVAPPVATTTVTPRQNTVRPSTTSTAPYTYPTNDYVEGSVPRTGTTEPRPGQSLDISVPFQIPPLRLPIPRVYLPGF